MFAAFLRRKIRLDKMSYDAFCHRVGVELNEHLPKAFKDYNALIKVRRDASVNSITMVKGNVEYVSEVGLLSYYVKHQSGMNMRLIMGEIVEDLLNPVRYEKLSEGKPIIENKPCIVAMLGIFVGVSVCLIKRRGRKK